MRCAGRDTGARTAFGAKRPGMGLNLERAMAATSRFGGHMVSGHVDGVGRVRAVERMGRDWTLTVACDEGLRHGIILKGSVACDGVSLTIAATETERFPSASSRTPGRTRRLRELTRRRWHQHRDRHDRKIRAPLSPP